MPSIETAAGDPIAGLASVASFFLSRIDTAVDEALERKIAAGKPELSSIRGNAAIGSAKLAYARFKELFSSERFKKLEAKGAHVQRPLWASTSTKNPNYSDLLYVETLVGPQTVNTIPPKTLTALLDHGKVSARTIESALAETQAAFAALAQAGISLDDITAALSVAGVASFASAYKKMLDAIAAKQKRLAHVVA